jgi:small-conductance mechanosensitive channel
MTTPVDERTEPTYKMPNNTPLAPGDAQRSSDDDKTYVEEGLSNDTTQTQTREGTEKGENKTGLNTNVPQVNRMASLRSPSTAREYASRLDDDLAMLQVERAISDQDTISHNRSLRRERSRHEEPIDEFDAATNPLHERTAIYKPPEDPTTKVAKFFKKVHNSVWIVRYMTYIAPLVLIILIPLLIGALAFPDAHVGGVKMSWFCIWLEIVWLTLWAGRILAKCLPWPIGVVSSLFTNGSKKWRDMGKQLELPATLFFWWLAIEISFLPTMTNHHINGDKSTKNWEKTMNKVLVSIFVGVVLNFVEKIIIQLIAISFHLRTYADRIELNKFQIGSLAKLYKFSKQKIQMEDFEFEEAPSGAKTPGQFVKDAQKGTREVFSKFGDIAGKVAGDFTGRQVTASTHPQQVVLELLRSTSGSQVLARRLYRTFARPETETVHNEDLRNAFDNDDEADAAFSMFDKDMNGDISMEELEAVCVEIGQERKSITASLKDLDSVVSKLDGVFMFLVVVIAILVFISLISTSAAGVLTSAGSTVLALSWLFSATAQEFLQSIVFVFVKHPFDVGDRVTIYGNTGADGTKDDYFVKEIALLYTEFKKMEGHVVQAPNSYLNTLFILNQRRSGGLAEAIPNVIKFGTTLEQIEALRNRLLEFVRSEKREYQGNILTELKAVTEVHSLTLNVVFFYKSNWQNELLRLQRRNKFICALMIAMQEVGIEGPRMRFPGQKESFPVYLQNLPHTATPGAGHNGSPDNPQGFVPQQPHDEAFVSPDPNAENQNHLARAHPSILRHGSNKGPGESMAAMGKRVDFSLGMKDMSAGDMPGDVFDDRESAVRRRKTVIRVTSPSGTSVERKRSNDTGRSSALHTVTRSDSNSTTTRLSHRNRFFNRGHHAAADEETGIAGMADIPEVESSNISRVHLDPRSGVVNPAAINMSADDTFVPAASGAIPVESRPLFHGPRRSQTDDIEMRRLH